MNNSNATSALQISDLHVDIRRADTWLPILRGVNLSVAPGCIHALVGESGGGKSMVAKAATGLLPQAARISGGSICIDGKDVTHWSENQWRTLRGGAVSMVLQDPMTALNPVRRIGAQMADVLRAHTDGKDKCNCANRNPCSKPIRTNFRVACVNVW